MEAAHVLFEFLSFLLALAIAGFGVLKFIDKKFEAQEEKTTQGFKDSEKKVSADFESMWKKVDANKAEVKEDFKLYVKKDIHDKDIAFLERNSEDKIRSLMAVFQTECKYINEKLDKLIKHDETRNGQK